jgi:hypothetical protein
VLSGDAEEGLWARDEAAVHETRVRAKRMYFNCMGEGGSGERLVVRVPPHLEYGRKLATDLSDFD